MSVSPRPAGGTIGSREIADRAIIAAQVTDAVLRHRDQAGFVRLVAAELPRPRQAAWLEAAECLATGDVARATAAAERSIEAWIPLMASRGHDPRLPARILQAAAGSSSAPGGAWGSLAYPAVLTAGIVGLVVLLSAAVLSTFDSMFRDFGLQLPLLTKAVLAMSRFVQSIWQPLLVFVVLILLGRWLRIRWSAGSRATIATFTRSLARLVAADMPADEAVVIAGKVANVPSLDVAAPRRPMTYAAAAALDYEPRTAAILLDAVAASQEDLDRASRSGGPWFVGPALTVVVGLLVGGVLLAVLLPLLSMVSSLS